VAGAAAKERCRGLSPRHLHASDSICQCLEARQRGWDSRHPLKQRLCLPKVERGWRMAWGKLWRCLETTLLVQRRGRDITG
jgi:hypothetical protein